MEALAGMSRTARQGALIGCGLGVAAAVLFAAGSPAAPFVLLAGLAALLAASRQAFLLGAVLAVPLSAAGWTLVVARVGGAVLDARLVITFGLAGLVALALAIERPRPTRLEVLAACFGALIVVGGLLRSSSVLVWAPPAARWLSYAGIFVLARACTKDAREARRLGAVCALAFALPVAWGVAQLVTGRSPVITGVVRATSFGGRGPNGLAFAGQMLFVLGYALADGRFRGRLRWLLGVALGFAGVVASATRVTVLTALAAVAAVQAGRHHWRAMLVLPLLLAVALAARADLRDRYSTTLQGARSNTAPWLSDGGGVDNSSRFRLFVWSTILEGWRERPLLGIGPGMTAAAVASVSPLRRVPPHNDYIGVLAEEGIVGLALFLALQAGVLRALWRRGRSATGEASALAFGVLALFAAINVGGVLNNAMYYYDVQLPLWAMAGAVLGSLPGDHRVGDLGEAADRGRGVAASG